MYFIVKIYINFQSYRNKWKQIMVIKTLPYEKRAKNKTDYTILIFLIDSNAQFFFMKGA